MGTGEFSCERCESPVEGVEVPKRYRYALKKDCVVVRETDCVHTARSVGEALGAQLWRNLPDRSYLVTDYSIPPGEEKR